MRLAGCASPIPETAAVHFFALDSIVPGPPTATALSADARAAWINAGVHAYSKAYRR